MSSGSHLGLVKDILIGRDYENQKVYYKCTFPLEDTMEECGHADTLAGMCAHMNWHFNAPMYICSLCGTKIYDPVRVDGHQMENGGGVCRVRVLNPHNNEKNVHVLIWKARNMFIKPISVEEYQYRKNRPVINSDKAQNYNDGSRTPAYNDTYDEPDEEYDSHILSRQRAGRQTPVYQSRPGTPAAARPISRASSPSPFIGHASGTYLDFQNALVTRPSRAQSRGPTPDRAGHSDPRLRPNSGYQSRGQTPERGAPESRGRPPNPRTQITVRVPEKSPPPVTKTFAATASRSERSRITVRGQAPGATAPAKTTSEAPIRKSSTPSGPPPKPVPTLDSLPLIPHASGTSRDFEKHVGLRSPSYERAGSRARSRTPSGRMTPDEIAESTGLKRTRGRSQSACRTQSVPRTPERNSPGPSGRGFVSIKIQKPQEMTRHRRSSVAYRSQSRDRSADQIFEEEMEQYAANEVRQKEQIRSTSTVKVPPNKSRNVFLLVSNPPVAKVAEARKRAASVPRPVEEPEEPVRPISPPRPVHYSSPPLLPPPPPQYVPYSPPVELMEPMEERPLSHTEEFRKRTAERSDQREESSSRGPPRRESRRDESRRRRSPTPPPPPKRKLTTTSWLDEIDDDIPQQYVPSPSPPPPQHVPHSPSIGIMEPMEERPLSHAEKVRKRTAERLDQREEGSSRAYPRRESRRDGSRRRRSPTPPPPPPKRKQTTTSWLDDDDDIPRNNSILLFPSSNRRQDNGWRSNNDNGHRDNYNNNRSGSYRNNYHNKNNNRRY